MKISRRAFVAGGSAALVGLSMKGEAPIEGSFVNDNFAMGHALRDHGPFPPAKRTVKLPVVIVGAGIAGLSAAWRLDKRGWRDYVVLEMNPQAGGNSRWGQNEIASYPWAAHYVPVPGPKAAYVRELFEDLGVLRNGSWEERALCFEPKERLFLYGRWQEGIEPAIGLTAADREQFRALEERVAGYRASGEFTIPLETGRSRKFEGLDRISFAEWLNGSGIRSPLVRWYMDYCCRDDYGALAADTSAWAGIHYFASRPHEDPGPLTWPEGNGWIVRRLLERVGQRVRTGEPVHRIRPRGRGFSVLAAESEYLAEFVIFAAPSFIAPFVVEGMEPLHDFIYSPWLTANLTLERLPESLGEPTWDNVVYGSPTLGYVDAMHQSLRTSVKRTVWTFYWALAEGTPAQNRQLLLERDWSYWKEAILHDLARVHRDIRQCVSRLDVMRMGHAMVRPTVGSIFSEERRRLAARDGRLLFANSDLSGISIFEEAQYHGVKAAEKVLEQLGGRQN